MNINSLALSTQNYQENIVYEVISDLCWELASREVNSYMSSGEEHYEHQTKVAYGKLVYQKMVEFFHNPSPILDRINYLY